MDPLDLIIAANQRGDKTLEDAGHNPALDLFSQIGQGLGPLAAQAFQIHQNERQKAADAATALAAAGIGTGYDPAATPDPLHAAITTPQKTTDPLKEAIITGPAKGPPVPFSSDLQGAPVTAANSATPPAPKPLDFSPAPPAAPASTSQPTETPVAMAERLVSADPSLNSLPPAERTAAKAKLLQAIQTARVNTAALTEARRKELFDESIKTSDASNKTIETAAKAKSDIATADKTQMETITAAGKESVATIERNIDPSKLKPQNLADETTRIAAATGLPPSLVSSTLAQAMKTQATADAKNAMDLKTKQSEIDRGWATINETGRHNTETEKTDKIKADAEAAKAGLADPGVVKEIGEKKGQIARIDEAEAAYNAWQKSHPTGPIGKAISRADALTSKVGISLDPERKALTLKMKGIAMAAIHGDEGRIDPISGKTYSEALSDASDPEQVYAILDGFKSSKSADIDAEVQNQVDAGHSSAAKLKTGAGAVNDYIKGL